MPSKKVRGLWTTDQISAHVEEGYTTRPTKVRSQRTSQAAESYKAASSLRYMDVTYQLMLGC